MMNRTNIQIMCPSCGKKILISEYFRQNGCPVCHSYIAQLKMFEESFKTDIAKKDNKPSKNIAVLDRKPSKSSAVAYSNPNKSSVPKVEIGSIICLNDKGKKYVVIGTRSKENYIKYRCLAIEKKKKMGRSSGVMYTEVKGYPVYLGHAFSISDQDIGAVLDSVTQTTVQQLIELQKKNKKEYDRKKVVGLRAVKQYLRKKNKSATSSYATSAWRGLATTKGTIKIFRG